MSEPPATNPTPTPDPATGADATTAMEPATPSKPPRPRWQLWLWRTAQVFLGLILGLVVTEMAFRWRADDAFPHVNVYVPDAELGVRLEPGAEQGFKLRNNPRTQIRINRDGYRGPLPPPGEGDIVVVGDSQVFGLGVEENETFSAQLAALTGRTVLNAGVPTYGPREYTATAKEIMAKRKVATVIYTINFVNDLFESDRPNNARHAVWDGWAVRSETAPGDVTRFPGRKWLFSKSHAVYALRRWLHDGGDGDQADDRGFESEGTWRDLVEVGESAAQIHAREESAAAERNQEREARLSTVEAELAKTQEQIDDLASQLVPDLRGLDYLDENTLRYRAATADPGDILEEELAEESRSVIVTARLIRDGVRYRDRVEAQLAKRAERNAKARQAADAIARRDALAGERDALRSRPVERAFIPSVLAPRLREIQQACDEHGAELVVLALPIDVQVSADEWAKYGVTEPIDMMPTRVLNQDLIRTAETMGVRAVDAIEPLAKVDGAAFLDHDIHMTPAGHRAVAEALAAALDRPPPLPVPELSLPDGRTRVPLPTAWSTTPEATVRGSSRARCETVRIDEWLRVTCVPDGRRLIPSGIEVTQGGRGEAMVVVTADAATLVAPLTAGEPLRAMFYWTDHAQELVVDWPAKQTLQTEPTMAFQDPTGAGRPLAVTDDAARLCACHKQVENQRRCRHTPAGDIEYRQNGDFGPDCEPVCTTLYGEPSAACMATYTDDCASLLACARGDLSALPQCPPDHANAGGTGQCFALCSKYRPCASGVCTPWQGAHICVPEP